MKNFKRIKKDINVFNFKDEIKYTHVLWGDKRAKKISYQRETKSILLRCVIAEPQKAFKNCHQSRKSSVYNMFPKLTKFLEGFTEEIGGHLSRAIIVSLKPSGKVYLHCDLGTYYKHRDRYHLVIKSDTGSRMNCGNEEVVWKEGEVWWFNNKLPHEAFNKSNTEERIHLIFDIKPFSFLEELKHSFNKGLKYKNYI